MRTAISLLLVFLSTSAIAANQAPPAPAPAQTPTKIVLDPATVRTQLLKSNFTLEQQQKIVEDAKTNVSLARTGLFPSINVSAIFNGNFALSAIDFLVPFLIPSNWAVLDQNKHLFEASKHSYHALELDTYSSALAVYFNIRTDDATTQAYLEQAQDLRDVANYIQRAAQLGFASTQDVENALGNAEAAEGQASKMQVAMIKERAALRQILGLPEATEILFSEDPAAATVPPSDVESSTSPAEIEKAVEKALSIAPEKAQIDELISAAQAGTWSKAFGWINSATVGATPGSNGSSASFSKLQAKGSISLGLSIFPELELSNRNVEEVKDRLIELKQEDTQILEGNILAVQEAQKELDHFAQAEASLKDVYDTIAKQYQFGLANVYDILQAHKNLSSATVNRIQAELDLTLMRVTLHRTMLTDEFAKIPSCTAAMPAAPQKRGGLAGWFGGLFGHSNSNDNAPSILDLCKAK